MDYNEHALRPRSEKINLAIIEPAEYLTNFTLDSGAIYKKSVSYFVVDMAKGEASLTEASSASLSPGEWYYDALSNEVYVRMSDDSSPDNSNIVVTYRFFFSDVPYNLPYDLSSGEEVYFDGRFLGNSDISEDLDEEQVGIILESNTNVTLQNQDGYFDEIYDTLVWENKNVEIYNWSPQISLSEKKRIFKGVIKDKSFSTSSVKFQCKDFISRLRKPMSLTLFDSSDGNISDSFINTPKRRIYGKFDNLKCVPIDNVLAGFELTGTITGSSGSTTVTGTGTAFLDEVSPDDEITITVNGIEFDFTVSTVDSDTQLTISSEGEVNFANTKGVLEPERPYRKKNRRWHIAGHKLREPTTTVSSVTSNIRFEVNNIQDFEVGDNILVDGNGAIIRRIVNDEITLRQTLSSTPSIGDTVRKEPVSSAFIGPKRIVIDRDFTVSNTSTDAILELDDLAEFNITRARSIPGDYTFTNGSRTITVANADALNFLETRDWIRSDDITHTTFYEVLSVDEGEVIIRTPYAGSTTTTNAEYKKPRLVEDDTLVTVNCVGLEKSSEWIRTASQAVKDIVENDASLSVDSASFDEAEGDAPYTLSIAFPEDTGEGIPKIRDSINKINRSVFGSLTVSDDFTMKYTVLTTERPTDMEKLRDDDIEGDISVRSRNEIVKKTNGRYRPFVDRFKNEEAFKLYEYENDFVNELVGIETEEDVTLYLYEDTDAETITERYALFNSLSTSTLTVSGKLNLIGKKLNDKIWLAFDRLYKRYGGRNREKIGIVNGVKKTENGAQVQFNDLGNIFNRVMSIALNTSNEFTSADDDEKIKNGYIVDNDTEIPDSTGEGFKGSNIIG